MSMTKDTFTSTVNSSEVPGIDGGGEIALSLDWISGVSSIAVKRKNPEGNFKTIITYTEADVSVEKNIMTSSSRQLFRLDCTFTSGSVDFELGI